MNQIDEKYWNLLSKSLSDNLTPDEEKDLQDWLASDTDHQQLLQELKEGWNAAGQYGNHFSPSKQKAWMRISEKLQLEESHYQAPVRRLFTWTRAAAAIILLALTSWVIWQTMNQPEWIQLASAATVREVALPDGSKVWLHPNSTIRYLDNMNEKKQREVIMEGEAFFEVTHHPERPFIVQALETETKVLGTSFNVSARKDRPVIHVSVVTGKVQFRNNQAEKNKLVLEPGTQGAYTKATAQLTKKQTPNNNFLFWKSKRLDFSNTTVQDALDDLERSYGLQFVVKDASVTSKRITTSFQNESIEQIIEELQVLLDVKITKADNTYHIQPME